MNFRNHLFRNFSLAILSLVLTGLFAPSVNAQANQPLNLSFVGAGAAGPPSVVVLGDGTLIFKVTVFENVSGDLTGVLTEKITQVYPVTEENGLLPVTTSWKLVTADGTIEGYYSGLFQHMQTGDHMITQHGEVLTVTGAYVKLYQAKVDYKAILLADHMTVSGVLTIHPNEKQ
jgi:hypothetical protein